MSELEHLQARFAVALLTPGDNPGGLFRGDPGLMARRFALYRGNLTANWEKALANAYPVLRTLVGPEFFRALAREYGRATPLAEGDLNGFGHALADFLETFPPVSDYPYLPDIARLEWGLHLAHYATGVSTLAPSVLVTVALDTLDRLRLRLHAACSLVESPWNVLGIWEAHQPDGPPRPEDVATTSRALVCRPQWRAEVMALTAGELVALRAIDEGSPLGGALELAVDRDPEFDPAQALPRWLGAGVFSAILYSEIQEETPHELDA